jgi:hypothetical protein
LDARTATPVAACEWHTGLEPVSLQSVRLVGTEQYLLAVVDRSGTLRLLLFHKANFYEIKVYPTLVELNVFHFLLQFLKFYVNRFTDGDKEECCVEMRNFSRYRLYRHFYDGYHIFLIFSDLSFAILNYKYRFLLLLDLNTKETAVEVYRLPKTQWHKELESAHPISVALEGLLPADALPTAEAAAQKAAEPTTLVEPLQPIKETSDIGISTF